MFNYKDRVVVVTGASSGLGLQMSEGYAKQGASLVLLARREERVKENAAKLAEEYGIKAIGVKCDITDLESVQAAVKATIDTFGRVDVVVNNAGSAQCSNAEDTSDEEFEFNIDVDLTGVFRCCREFGKVMIEQNYGRIINISSMYGLCGNNEAPAVGYHAAKGGVVNLTRALSAEWAKYNITVNTICPGYFETELTVDTLNTDEFKAYMDRTVPVGRYGKAGELNAAAIFLGSDEASYVTGVALPVDGGYTAI